ncbi:MAG: hydrogenase iron-sulfur subunit [Chloroflexi bacterium]|nr:hydrogenase iron-sulfur subunit [Chloroflexota bacterium]
MALDYQPKIVGFLCNWCSYAGADMAGTSRLTYPPNIRIIRVPCSGRVDATLVTKCFQQGADAVLVAGCHPGECHYSEGNYHARRRFTVLRELLSFLGIEKDRLRLEWVSAAEGKKFSQLVSEFSAEIAHLGPRKDNGKAAGGSL